MQAAPFPAVQQFLEAELQWQPLGSDSINRLYYAHAGRGTVEQNGVPDGAPSLVLRVNAPPEQVPGVDRVREALLLAHLQGQPWAPQLLHCSAGEQAQAEKEQGGKVQGNKSTKVQQSGDHGWLLMRWHGESPAVPLSTGSREQLLAAVASWQRIELPENALQMNYAALLRGYGAQLAGLPMERALLQMVARAQRELLALPAVPRVLTHHDLHPGNLCVLDSTLVVVDWEYAGLGCAWFDAAALTHRFDVQPAELARLPAFGALDAQSLEQGLQKALWLNEALQSLWYWARGLAGTQLTMAELMRDTLRLLKQPE